jgi:hypothetical protein
LTNSPWYDFALVAGTPGGRFHELLLAFDRDLAVAVRSGDDALGPARGERGLAVAYGYLNRVPSSRRVERECQRNIEVIWLTGQLAPDFKTIADFRMDNGAAIRPERTIVPIVGCCCNGW